MTTYKINPRDGPGLPRTWIVIKISDGYDGNTIKNTVEQVGEFKVEADAKRTVSILEALEVPLPVDAVDEFSDWHTWKGNEPK